MFKKIFSFAVVVVMVALALTGCTEAFTKSLTEDNTPVQLAKARRRAKAKVLTELANGPLDPTTAHAAAELVGKTLEKHVPVAVMVSYLTPTGDEHSGSGIQSMLQVNNEAGRDLVTYGLLHAMLGECEPLAEDIEGDESVFVSGIILHWCRNYQDFYLVDEDADGAWDYATDSYPFAVVDYTIVDVSETDDTTLKAVEQLF